VIPSANIFQPLIDVFESVLKFFHDNVGVGWGMSIICLTIVVRAALIPLTLRQFKSMQALQRLAPEIKALQAKYKDDRQKLNQEMMKFYQENKVNPFGSCLPLLLQLPVFLSLFYMLRKDLKLDICGDALARHFNVAHASEISSKIIQKTPCEKVAPGAHLGKFLFINDLTDKATGAVLVTLIVLYIGSQLASSLLMSVTADRNQRMLMIGLPFLFTAFIINFPAGLIVYWITTNLWTVVQQQIVRRTVGHPQAVPAGAMAAAGGGSGGRAARGSPPGGKAKEGKDEPVAAASRERSGPPPPPPRKKKKRSGRRR
jgi:YidC/Oxa1 family membrane protein insertase